MLFRSDFRLLNDDADLSKIPEKLNALSPKGIEFYDCFEPQDRLGDVAFAKYEIFFDDNCSLFNDLSEFLSKNEIICQKKTKKGDIKTFNFKEKIQSLQIADTVFGTKILLTLPAGSVDNVNPELLLNTYFETAKEYYPYSIIRLTVLNKEKKPFR